MKHLVFIMALFFTPFIAVSSVAQTTTGGTIFGRITDPSGAPVQDVDITTKSPNVGGDFKAVSDSTGDYRFAGLPIATNYTITVEAKGFSRFERKNLVVRAGVTISVDIQLAIGSVNESVEVTGDPPLIDTQNAEQTVNLSGELLRNIPITGRREWSDTLQVTPGIISASSDAYGGQTYFLRGSENENHATLLDGVDIGSFLQNWPSNYISISTESLGDVQIKTGGNDASSPAAMGIVINMASPTGADRYHGVASLLISPRALNSNNTPGGTSAVSEALQPDFSFGGPIKKGRAWFFASGRYINRNDGISRTQSQLTQLSALDPGFQAFDNEARGFVYLANSTVRLSDRQTLFGLVQYDSRTQGGNFQYYAGNFAPNQYGGGAYALRLSSQWTPRLTTRFLVGYNNKGSNDNLGKIGGVGTQPELDVYSGVVASSGKLVGSSQIATLNNLSSRGVSPSHKATVSGDVSYLLPEQFGSHEIQTGYYLQPKMSAKTTTYYANGGYLLQDVVPKNPADPSAGYVPFHRQTVDTTSLVTSYIGANDYAYYIQDHWRPTNRLSLTAGLRADWISGQDLLFDVSTQHSWNYAPRVAGAYMLTKNQKNVIRASWSKITDIPNASYLGTAGSSSATITDSYDLDRNGTFETTFVTPGATRLSANKTLDSNRHQGYAGQWLVGYRSQFPGEIVLDASLINVAYKDRPAQVDVNQIYDGKVWQGLNDPTQNNIYLVTNNKWNWFVYRGIEFTLTKQTRTVALVSTYTYSRFHLDGTWQPNDPASFIQPDAFADSAGLGTVRGNTTNSLTGSADTRDRMWQHHQWRTAITWNAPWKLRASNILTAQSGTPTGPVTTNIAAPDPQFGPATLTVNGRRVSNPLATTYRFAFDDRGDGQLWTPWLVIWNTRFGREFSITERSSIEVVADIFNLTNRGAAQQFLSGGNQINGSNFGGLQNVQLPRSAQFSARWHF